MGKKDFFRYITMVSIGFILSGIIFILNRPVQKTSIQIFTPTPKTITVYLSGEISQPGIYTLPKNSRLYELIDMAGGFTSETDKENLNLAAVLYDGQHINLSNHETVIFSEVAANPESKPDFTNEKININSASTEDLINLPGIGETKAAAIIQFRDKNGPFEQIEDILNVPGIGDYTFNLIKDLIVTNKINE